MFLHTDNSEVDYESLHNETSSLSRIVGIEFIQYPVNSSSSSSSSESTEQCLKNKTELELQFTVPLHMRYQLPTDNCIDSSDNYAYIHLFSPQVLVRCSTTTSADYDYASRISHTNYWVYNTTRLGKIGNNARYIERFGGHIGYIPTTISIKQQNHTGISFRLPVGCTTDRERVISMTLWTVSISFLFLLFLLFIKKS